MSSRWLEHVAGVRQLSRHVLLQMVAGRATAPQTVRNRDCATAGRLSKGVSRPDE
jgi:hypothetical protein